MRQPNISKKKNISNISFEFFSMEDYKKEFELFKEWHEKNYVKLIDSLIPILSNKTLMKQYSASDEEKLVV